MRNASTRKQVYYEELNMKVILLNMYNLNKAFMMPTYKSNIKNLYLYFISISYKFLFCEYTGSAVNLARKKSTTSDVFCRSKLMLAMFDC